MLPALVVDMLFTHAEDDLRRLGATTPKGSAVILRGQHEAEGHIQIPGQRPIQQEIVGPNLFHLADWVAVDAHDVHPDLDLVRSKRIGFEDLALFGLLARFTSVTHSFLGKHCPRSGSPVPASHRWPRRSEILRAGWPRQWPRPAIPARQRCRAPPRRARSPSGPSPVAAGALASSQSPAPPRRR